MKKDKDKTEETLLEEKKSGSKNIAKPQTGENRLEKEEGFITPNNPEETSNQSAEAQELNKLEIGRSD